MIDLEEDRMSFGGRVLGTTFIVAGGALAIAAVLGGPRLLRAARPALRDGLRQGVRLYDRIRRAAAELADDVEDLLAEVKSDARKADESFDELKRAPHAAPEG